MDNETRQIVEAMAVNEEKIMELYSVFAYKFPKDAGLWNKLTEEEKMHAHMVRAIGDLLKDNDVRLKTDRFSRINLQNLRERIEKEIRKANAGGYNSESALEYAALIEKTLLESKAFEAFESDIPDMKKLLGVILYETQKHAKILEEYMS
ncbi:MAG: hypothetical protein CVV21_03645 [Candidatus Goldiibacteriota bacterium HGW-Goldbacteria-1]|nr:MAG: hypothetical protein CVV21_03645 [Candidatus Goldiibacteriota bacterium HGW-Goldbacteria-1]